MKNRSIYSLLTVVLGLLVVLVPTVLFPVCDSSEMRMACYYSGQTAIGQGCLIVLLGVISFFFSNKGVRAGISIAQLLNSILVLIYPAKLIGLCKMETMDCRMKTFPAIIVVGTLLIVISLANSVYLILKSRK